MSVRTDTHEIIYLYIERDVIIRTSTKFSWKSLSAVIKCDSIKLDLFWRRYGFLLGQKKA